MVHYILIGIGYSNHSHGENVPTPLLKSLDFLGKYVIQRKLHKKTTRLGTLYANVYLKSYQLEWNKYILATMKNINGIQTPPRSNS